MKLKKTKTFWKSVLKVEEFFTPEWKFELAAAILKLQT